MSQANESKPVYEPPRLINLGEPLEQAFGSSCRPGGTAGTGNCRPGGNATTGSCSPMGNEATGGQCSVGSSAKGQGCATGWFARPTCGYGSGR